MALLTLVPVLMAAAGCSSENPKSGVPIKAGEDYMTAPGGHTAAPAKK